LSTVLGGRRRRSPRPLSSRATPTGPVGADADPRILVWIVVKVWGGICLNGSTAAETVLLTIDVVGVVLVRPVDWRWDDDALWEIASRLESHGVCAILDDPQVSCVDVEVTVFARNSAVGVTSFQFKGTVLSLVTVGVTAVFIVLINLLENSDWLGSGPLSVAVSVPWRVPGPLRWDLTSDRSRRRIGSATC